MEENERIEFELDMLENVPLRERVTCMWFCRLFKYVRLRRIKLAVVTVSHVLRSKNLN